MCFLNSHVVAMCVVWVACCGFAQGVKYLHRRTQLAQWAPKISESDMTLYSILSLYQYCQVYFSEIRKSVLLRWFCPRREISSSSDEQPLVHPLTLRGTISQIVLQAICQIFHTTRWIWFNIERYLVTFCFSFQVKYFWVAFEVGTIGEVNFRHFL